MVFYAIVARLDPAQSRIQVAVILLFSVFLSKNAVKKTEKSEITATWILLSLLTRWNSELYYDLSIWLLSCLLVTRRVRLQMMRTF